MDNIHYGSEEWCAPRTWPGTGAFQIVHKGPRVVNTVSWICGWHQQSQEGIVKSSSKIFLNREMSYKMADKLQCKWKVMHTLVQEIKIPHPHVCPPSLQESAEFDSIQVLTHTGGPHMTSQMQPEAPSSCAWEILRLGRPCTVSQALESLPEAPKRKFQFSTLCGSSCVWQGINGLLKI